MKVVDLTTKTQALRVRLDGSPVYDMLAAIYLAENWTAERGFEVERSWVRRARTALGPRLRRDLRFFAKARGLIMGTVSLLDARPGLPVEEFIRLVASTPAGDLVERMLTAPVAAHAVVPLLREAWRVRTPSAIRTLLRAYPPEYDPARVRAFVLTPPQQIRERLVGLLRGFYGKVYQREEPLVRPLLRADLQAKQALAAVLPPVELVERATGGFALGPDSGIAQVVLAPTYFFRPYNLISEYPGTRVFVYPLEAGTPAGSPSGELARLFKALGDETRLRILEMLGEREMYLQEVANRLGVTHVTAIHHLALLRAARLVRVVERANLKYYQLRPDVAASTGERLRALLGQRTAEGQRS